MATIKKLFSILTRQERLAGVSLVALMLVGMVLEMLGIGIVVPALSAMSSNMDILRSPRGKELLAFLGHPSPSQLILGGLVVVLVLYGIKAAFLVFANWRQAAFVSRFQARVSQDLFRRYLLQPWAFHISRNSADLIRNLNEVHTLANSCSSFLMLVTESLVLVGILGVLLWNEPRGALAVAVVTGFAAMLLQASTQRKLSNWGKRYWGHVGDAHRIFTEGLQGAKDIKVLGREEALLAAVADHKREQARLGARNSAIQQVPRLWFELVAVLALCSLTAVMVSEGKEPLAMVPILGLFAAAAFRLLPSINRLVLSLQTLRFNSAIIDTLHADLGLDLPSAPVAKSRIAVGSGIRLEQVSFQYAGAASPSLKDVNIEIPSGTAAGFIGESGAGKSTLVDVLLGLLSPTNGRVTVNGVDISENVRGWQCQIGYVPQSIFLSDDTLRANVAFGVPCGAIDDAAVNRALTAAQLDGLVQQLPDGVNSMVGDRGLRLSGGQRQRIGIARALYHDPQVLVLDEATSALDSETERGVMASVNALHGTKTIIIVAHRLSTVANCDIVYRLERGEVIAAGSLAHVTDPK